MNSSSMDALAKALNLDELPESSNADPDPLGSFVTHAQNYKEFLVNSEMLEELESLDSRQKVLDGTLRDVIPPLQKYLDTFHLRLEVLTKDLNFIKGKSTELNQLLQENSNKLAKISPLVNDLVISPEIVKQVINGKLDSSFIECISYLNDKQAIYDQYKGKETPKDFIELCRILQTLKSFGIARSKKFIVMRIKRLRSTEPVPSQQIQKELLDVREIFQFISQNNLSLALELRQAYTYTIRWYYREFFARYIRSITILQFVNVTDHYALGQGLSNTSLSSSGTYLLGRSLFPGLNTSFNMDDAVNQYFQVDRRISILRQEDKTVMVSQIAENNHMQNYLEIGFKNLNLAILDNCTAEFTFLNEFFKLEGKNCQELRGLLEQIFKPTFEKAMHYTEQLIGSTYDLFGILICICLTHHLQYEAQKRKIPVIDDYLNGQLILLWPKFQRLVDFQCDNLRQVKITVTTAQFAGADKDPLVTPHELTVQFSKFLTSVLILSTSYHQLIDEKSEPLYNSITRIRNEFEVILQKCSKKTRQPEKFLVLNYMYLLNALQQKAGVMNQEGTQPLILIDTRNRLNHLVELNSQN
ncbi:Vps52p Ecym_2791 [Eremothecium cymbalariae DBVPG|uniref:Vacuolar protein sorting-associated protein 52 n=1 Tax=Eremothecium cymbalariae (strain CBS 270.75 / DBVPG 7215 / KCTC 17166 / NRRL Y-17582) TaxID=931890 RepID=G8JQ26_ERECY|nr:Hypothetical protein Ecym_2791 [Eremothecium cymbalariae DBVPG\